MAAPRSRRRAWQPVLSEWEEIEARHRRADGGEQFPHTAAICMFLHHARVRGFTTVACPVAPLNGAEPDALIRRGEWGIYVEIQRRGGAAWRRARKWRRQYELQGYAAICASSPGLAQELAHEAQVAQVPQGVVTDLVTLARSAPQGLWTHSWASLHSPLQPVNEPDRASVFGRHLRRGVFRCHFRGPSGGRAWLTSSPSWTTGCAWTTAG